ncbi:hypothetical protein T12_4872 [Trichinella patagoniensis]|uniref:Uncharacterized protein n=1 Tax=Trichinella patagoniensis TaxID=990121 RepID=A0A0V0ZTJ5_9BILA|nr:hypothetical protein T12_4872 [Trichinella patagoniensis]
MHTAIRTHTNNMINFPTAVHHVANFKDVFHCSRIRGNVKLYGAANVESQNLNEAASAKRRPTEINATQEFKRGNTDTNICIFFKKLYLPIELLVTYC